MLESIDRTLFDSFTLGNPFCLRIEGNLLADFGNFKKAVSLLKNENKKIYLSTPVCPMPSEFKLIKKTLTECIDYGLDGIEVNDIGVLRLVREIDNPPPIHIGPFINIYTSLALNKMADLKAQRVHPAYELSLKEIQSIASKYKGDLELCIHGIIPVSVMNFCQLKGNSIEFLNRNKCKECLCNEYSIKWEQFSTKNAGRVLLSGKHIALIESLYLLSNISTFFRIEGLYESPKHLTAIGRVYREALNNLIEKKNLYTCKEKWKHELNYYSQGLCNGFYFESSGMDYIV